MTSEADWPEIFSSDSGLLQSGEAIALDARALADAAPGLPTVPGCCHALTTYETAASRKGSRTHLPVQLSGFTFWYYSIFLFGNYFLNIE